MFSRLVFAVAGPLAAVSLLVAAGRIAWVQFQYQRRGRELDERLSNQARWRG